MSRYEIASVFGDEIRNYIADKVASGFSEESYYHYLIAFDKFCIAQHIETPTFSADHAKIWMKQREEEAHTTYYDRINASKNFLKYLALKGYDVYVVRDVAFKGTDFKPYIYTPKDVERYFLAVDTFSSRKNRKDAIQYPVLFRILYCCGTRISETLGIRKKDIDLKRGIILLNETKNSKQRYVVAGDDLKLLLQEFADKCFYLLGDEDYIFTNSCGGRIDEKTIYEHHRRFLREAGISYLGEGFGPRIHDWRHHMAVYSFKQLSDMGLDLYAALPILSTYLGHKTIFATEKYVRLTLELFPSIEKKFQPLVDSIFGGIADENN